jgi:hypothetical protein
VYNSKGAVQWTELGFGRVVIRANACSSTRSMFRDSRLRAASPATNWLNSALGPASGNDPLIRLASVRFGTSATKSCRESHQTFEGSWGWYIHSLSTIYSHFALFRSLVPLQKPSLYVRQCHLPKTHSAVNWNACDTHHHYHYSRFLDLEPSTTC